MPDGTLPDDRLAGVRVTPLAPLALLETLRASDTPEELLEDEDVRQSLPRRLGLSRAVDGQIRRYRELEKRGAWLGGGEMADLLELVDRRPDSASVFEKAGRWLLRTTVETGGFGPLRSGLAAAPLPGAVRHRLALRTARRTARQTNPGASEVRTELDPAALIVAGSFPAACQAPDACRMTAGALGAAFALHSAGAEDGTVCVVHPLCEARGDRCCVWRLEEG